MPTETAARYRGAGRQVPMIIPSWTATGCPLPIEGTHAGMVSADRSPCIVHVPWGPGGPPSRRLRRLGARGNSAILGAPWPSW